MESRLNGGVVERQDAGKDAEVAGIDRVRNDHVTEITAGSGLHHVANRDGGRVGGLDVVEIALVVRSSRKVVAGVLQTTGRQYVCWHCLVAFTRSRQPERISGARA